MRSPRTRRRRARRGADDAEDRAWARTKRMTWRRVAPAARSRPTSRTRSATVIDSVLKMRNAPTNSATAAMSAVVAWKSAVEAAAPPAMSAGDERTYGSAIRRDPQRGRVGRGVRAGRERRRRRG